MSGPALRRALAHALAGLWLLLAAAACQPLPRPFEAQRGPLSLNDLASMGPQWGVVVLPVNAMPGNGGATLAAGTAAALRARGIAASETGRSEGRYTLTGEALAAIDSDQDNASVSIVWVVRDPRGGIYARTAVAQTIPADEWRTGRADMLDQLATVSAGQIAPLIDAGGGATVGLPRPDVAPRVHLGPVDGAPGDGREALATALIAALDLRGIRVAAADAEVPLITATVTVAPSPNGERLAIRWAVLNPDGSEIGAVEQENEILPGKLDGRWGPLAYDIATGAAEGLEDLLKSTPAP